MDKLVIRGGELVLETELVKKDLVIEGEKITKLIEPDTEIEDDYTEIEADGKIVMPGVIDAHTHYLLHSRGTTTADNFRTGSISAAFGGVTTFIDYSDFQAEKTLLQSAQERIAEAEGEAVIDFHLHQMVEDFNEKIAEELAEIRDFGISSLKIFTTYKKEGYMIAEERLPALFARAADLGLLITAHSEDEEIIQEKLEDYQAVKENLTFADHPDLRPGISEGEAVRKLAEIAKDTGHSLYIVHISSKEGIQALRAAQENGVKIYGETTPHYLGLDRSYLEGENAARYFMVPPLREVEDHQEIWDAVIKGDIQVVATDHCAFSLEQKNLSDSPLSALPGIPGSETLLPVLHHLGVNRGLLNYIELANLLAVGPAKAFGLYPDRGTIKEGSIADLVIFDPDKEMALTGDNLHSEAGYSPFADFTVLGYPVQTISRGEIIIDADKYQGESGRGQFIKAGKSDFV
ncbi:MAG: amidohydrolase family protein [Bacillota bacterium]